MFENITLGDFLQKVGESSNPPGGGVCAGLVANLGISLLRMSCVIIAEKNIKDKNIFSDLIKKFDDLEFDFFELMKKDADIFSDFLNFDRFSDKKKEDVIKESCYIPVSMIKKIINCMHILCSIELKKMKELKCDIISGIEFLTSAHNVCCHNIISNSDFFVKKINKQEILKELNILKEEFENLRNNITWRFENEKI